MNKIEGVRCAAEFAAEFAGSIDVMVRQNGDFVVLSLLGEDRAARLTTEEASYLAEALQRAAAAAWLRRDGRKRVSTTNPEERSDG